MQAKFQSMMQEQKKAVEAAQSKLEKLTEVKKGNPSKDETPSSGSDMKTPPKQPLIDVTKLKDFRIKGQVGNPNQKEKLSYISLMNEIGAGITNGYPEHDIVMTVIESISPDLPIKDYLEALQGVTLSKVKQIMRAHFEEMSSTELYQSLVNMAQLPDEDPQEFLMWPMNVRQ